MGTAQSAQLPSDFVQLLLTQIGGRSLKKRSAVIFGGELVVTPDV